MGNAIRRAPRGVVVRASHLELNDVPAPIADGGEQRRLRRAKRHPAHANAAIHGRGRRRAREMCGCGAPLRPQGPPAWKPAHDMRRKNCRLWDLRNLGFVVLASPQPHNTWRGHDELPRDIPQESRASSGGARGALGASAAALTRRGCLRKTRARWRCTRIPSFPRTRGAHRPRRSACVRNPRRRPARRHTPGRIPLRPPPRSTPRCPSRCVPPPRPPASHPLVRRPGRARKPKSSRRSRLPSPTPAHPPPPPPPPSRRRR